MNETLMPNPADRLSAMSNRAEEIDMVPCEGGRQARVKVAACFECGSPSAHDHHVVPAVRGGTKTIPLCKSCHSAAHGENFASLIGEGKEWAAVIRSIPSRALVREVKRRQDAAMPYSMVDNLIDSLKSIDQQALDLWWTLLPVRDVLGKSVDDLDALRDWAKTTRRELKNMRSKARREMS